MRPIPINAPSCHPALGVHKGCEHDDRETATWVQLGATDGGFRNLPTVITHTDPETAHNCGHTAPCQICDGECCDGPQQQ